MPLQPSTTHLPPADIADNGRCGEHCLRRAMPAVGDGCSQTAAERNFAALAYSKRNALRAPRPQRFDGHVLRAHREKKRGTPGFEPGTS